MAILEQINFKPMSLKCDPLSNNAPSWVELQGAKGITKLPQIFFDDGEPWMAANEYALHKLEGVEGKDIKTVLSNMNHLKAYAAWLEENEVDWRHFPTKKKDRCLFRFRGYLIEQRKVGLLSPSTVTTRMRAIIQFYRWAKVYGWVERGNLWEDRRKVLQFFTATGFSRTMSVFSSELAIPNRQRQGDALEDGLTPITVENRSHLIQFLHQHGLVELNLMTLIACFTGARSETIRTLRLSTLENVFDDLGVSQMKRIHVGPPTPVKTKYDVSGSLLMPLPLLQELERYSVSARRLKRQARATEKHQTLLFLSERGNPYSQTTFTKLISDLREKMVRKGLQQFKYFKFHQTRATFGTQLMTIALETLSKQLDALLFVRDAMLHKDEATTWKYIKFIEKQPIKEQLASEFFDLFTGNAENAEKLISQVIYDNKGDDNAA